MFSVQIFSNYQAFFTSELFVVLSFLYNHFLFIMSYFVSYFRSVIHNDLGTSANVSDLDMGSGVVRDRERGGSFKNEG